MLWTGIFNYLMLKVSWRSSNSSSNSNNNRSNLTAVKTQQLPSGAASSVSSLNGSSNNLTVKNHSDSNGSLNAIYRKDKERIDILV